MPGKPNSATSRGQEGSSFPREVHIHCKLPSRPVKWELTALGIEEMVDLVDGLMEAAVPDIARQQRISNHVKKAAYHLGLGCSAGVLFCGQQPIVDLMWPYLLSS
jgi:hypothetical protein